MSCDPLFANVPLLLHMDVAIPYIDSSSYGHTVVAYPSDGNVPLDTSTFKFGPGAATFPFGSSTIVVADAAEFDFSATTDWTAEMWIRPNSNHDGASYRPILNKRPPGTSDFPPFNIRLDGSNNLIASGSGASTNYTITGPSLPSNVWYAVELDRHGNTLTLRVNGVTVGTATISGNLGNPAQPIEVGGMQSEGANFGGWIDEVRLTRGVQRYAADYTPAVAPFDNVACVLVPAVVGLPQATAITAITSAGFTLGTVTTAFSSVQASGFVISQSPGAGGFASPGDPVSIQVSLGFAPGVVAPPPDNPGKLIDAQIVVLQNLSAKAANANAGTLYYDYQQQLDLVQRQAVDHYMVTGWLNPDVVLAMYQPPSWDKVGQALAARVAFLQNLVNNPPTMPPGNAYGYGSSGWTTILQNYQTALYAAKIALVERMMDVPGGTSAGLILASFNGSQSFPFAYSFQSVGFNFPTIDN